MDLNRRNTEAAAQSLKSMDEAVRAQQIRIDSLHATISGLMQRINDLENAIGIMRVQAMGRGPTVK